MIYDIIPKQTKPGGCWVVFKTEVDEAVVTDVMESVVGSVVRVDTFCKEINFNWMICNN